jgi:aryl-alcohol dehydrogenase-like predicted oxidoreductase
MTAFAHLPATIRIADLEVCRLGFGAMQLPGPMVWGEPKNPDEARAVLRRVVEAGMNLIDTSWYYGPLVANRLIAEVLRPYKKDLVIATKLGGRRTPDKMWAHALRPEELREGCENDLRGLQLERVDICHLRVIPNAEVPFTESLDAMIALKAEGKIRHIGLSNISLAQLETALARTPIATVQNLYNVAAGEKRLAASPIGSIAGQEAIVEHCEKLGIAFLPFFPLRVPGPPLPSETVARVARSRGVTESQVAIAWLLARSPVMLPIPGTSSLAHLEENWAARTLKLTGDELAEIARARE